MAAKRMIAGLLALVACVGFLTMGYRLVFGEPQAQLGTSLFVVYFPSQHEGLLHPEFHVGAGTIKERLDVLESGPRSEALMSPLPIGTSILDYSLNADDGILTVSFSPELVTNHPGGSLGERISVYGIVNTLTAAPGVDAVLILVNGQVIPSLAGHLALHLPLRFDPSLVFGWTL